MQPPRNDCLPAFGRRERRSVLWLLALTLLCGCGDPPPPKSWAPAKVEGADEPATKTVPAGDAATVAEPAPAKQPRELWARQNAKRVDQLAEQVELTAEEREKILALWATERTEILRLLLTERNQRNPKWDMVHKTVVDLREQNDKHLKTWLGDSRFEAYTQVRPQGPSLPKVEPPPEPPPTQEADSDEPGGE